jgi:N-methylhydantoinase B/oxoprolinase/acetone carboxylase alpha subunit
MTDINDLTAQIAALAEAIGQLQPTSPSNVLQPFTETSAEVRKAAHNAGRQAQRRTSKKAKNYTAKYKTAYDAYCNSKGFKGKYESRVQ